MDGIPRYTLINSDPAGWATTRNWYLFRGMQRRKQQTKKPEREYKLILGKAIFNTTRYVLPLHSLGQQLLVGVSVVRF